MSIDILGFRYTLKPVDPDAADMAGVYGWVNHGKQLIRYVPTDPIESVRDTILHEIGHAIHHICGIGDKGKDEDTENLTEERRVKIYTTMLRKVLLDNPSWKEYLLS